MRVHACACVCVYVCPDLFCKKHFLSYTKAPAMDRNVLMCKMTTLYIDVNFFLKVQITRWTICFDSEFYCRADAYLDAKFTVQQD